MKIFKQADLLVQTLAITACFIWVLAPGNEETRLFISFFIIGGLQLLSFFTHLFLKKNWLSSKQRDHYGKTLFWVLVTGIVSYTLTPLLLLYLFGLLIASPVLAAWYLMICISEWKRIKYRELVHLK